MKKTMYFPGLPFLVAAAAVTLVPAASALAAEGTNRGWQQEGDQQVYLNPDGSKKTEAWVKSEDGDVFYLDENGYIVKDTILEIDDHKYYVDENGVKVKDKWISRPNDDDQCEHGTEIVWYYFDNNGAAYAGTGSYAK